MKPLAFIVDDDSTSRTGLEMALQDLGFETIIAENYDGALQILEEHKRSRPFTAATIDLAIPGGFGLSLIERYPDILSPENTLIVTGYFDEFQAGLQRVRRYSLLDKRKLGQNPYTALIEAVLGLPTVKAAGIQPP